MGKAKAVKSKAAGKKPSKRKSAPQSKRASKTAAKSASSPTSKRKGKKAASNILGGVAKGIAWLGDKVRGVVSRKKPATKKKAAAKRGKTAKRAAKPAKPAPAQPAASTEDSLITLYNPLP
jgi:hypothetical protein